jgi:hypothetical protein
MLRLLTSHDRDSKLRSHSWGRFRPYVQTSCQADRKDVHDSPRVIPERSMPYDNVTTPRCPIDSRHRPDNQERREEKDSSDGPLGSDMKTC